MGLAEYIAGILSAVIILLGLRVFILSIRKRKDDEELIVSSTYHCLKCGSVYTSNKKESSQACPKCRYKNAKLKF